MTIFKLLETRGHEQVVYCYDQSSGLKAIIAIHSTKLGPSLGGCRMYPYAKEKDALEDVLRLSRGMTYKAAVTGLNLGGGKAVIIGDPKKQATKALFRAFGHFVERLNGRYITAEDVGTCPQYMAWVHEETEYVVGLPTADGGSGDPSPITAHGVFLGIKAAVKKVFNRDDLKDIKIAVQGIGHVGHWLCKELHQVGAKLFVEDINPEAVKCAVKLFKATPVSEKELYGLDVDVYSPCALGATLNNETISQLKCKIVAGAANNQLKNGLKHSEALKQRGILYAPDYVINAGGLINVYVEIVEEGVVDTRQLTENIYQALMDIFNEAEKENITTYVAANNIAEKRLKTKEPEEMTT